MVPINYLAVLAAGIVSVILGFLWYGPLFGKPWMKLMGLDKFSPEEMEKGKKMMPMNTFIQFVASLVMIWILAHALIFADAYLGMSGWTAGVFVGFMNWLGFVASVTIGMVLWEGKPWKLWFILNGYNLVNLCIAGVILALWQ